MKDLLASTALITGASSGIGAEFARQLAPIAAQLILVARREDRLEELAEQLRVENPALRVAVRPTDLTNMSDTQLLCDWIETEGFELDLLINNAGLGDHGPFETADWSRLDEMLQVNVVALTYLCHRLVPSLRYHRPGAILNVSSMASMMPIPGLGVYAATKAYVSSFSESLRAELAGTGVGVTHLCPGPVETEFASVARRDNQPTPGQVTPEMLEVSVQQVVSEALHAIAHDRPRVVPGALAKLAAVTIALAPLFLLRFFLARRVEAMRPARHLEHSDFDAEYDLP
jgi:short-subunit dehydrogenase